MTDASRSTEEASREPDARWVRRAEQPGASEFEARTFREVARLRWTYRTGLGGYDTRDVFSPGQLDHSLSAMHILAGMGLETLPILAEALEDSTPSCFVEARRSPKSAILVLQVNELVGRMIVGRADRKFMTGERGDVRALVRDLARHPDSVPVFQKQVLDWYAQNRTRTPEQRKIADVGAAHMRIRLDAVEWLGKRQALASRAAIEEYAERTLAVPPRSSSLETEVSECAVALGQIGDARSLPVVRRICDYLVDGLRRWGISTSGTLTNIFRAHQGLALLGEKEAALRELEQCVPCVKPQSLCEYHELLLQATSWPCIYEAPSDTEC